MTEPLPVPNDEAPDEQTAEFKGQTFRLNSDVADYDTMAFFRMLKKASRDPDAYTIDGMVVVLDFALEIVHPDDRDRFDAHAQKQRASVGDLLGFILGQPAEEIERPTERSSDSSDGPTETEPKSAANSAAKASPTRGAFQGRPDLELVAARSRRHKIAS